MPGRESTARELEEAVEEFYANFPYPPVAEFASQFALDFELHCARKFRRAPPPALSEAIGVAVCSLYQYEAPAFTFERRTHTEPVAHARYRDHLLAILKFREKPHHYRLHAFTELLTSVFEPLIVALPQAICVTADQEPPETPTAPLYSALPNPNVMDGMLAPFVKVLKEDELFQDGRMGARFGALIAEKIKQRRSPIEDTPFAELLEAEVPALPAEEVPEPPELPLSVRFQGQWVIGTQGTGKTQLFQFMLSRDLDMVAAGKASIVVLDPTGDKEGRLIHNLITLKRFAPGGDLHGKLVYIDPKDRGYTLPINLLSLRANFDDEESVGSAISSYLSIMGGLMGQPLTSFQEPVFRYAVQAALAFPNPTLSTLRDILSPSSKAYQQVLPKLHPDVRAYFQQVYDTEGPRRSRSEILNRLFALSSDAKFRRLFNAVETKIDFFEEINRPKVIVINASRDYLQSLTELYGRYFLALITGAGEHRASMPTGSPIPCFIYIDECDEFVANDPNAAKILLKLRGMRMALILGNQLVSRITDTSVQESFLGTAIKFVNANSASARTLAEEMNCVTEAGRIDPSFLIARPSLNFAFHIRGQMPKPIAVQIPYGVLESQPHMSSNELEQIRSEIRERYYVSTEGSRQTTPSAPEGDNADDPVQLLARAYQSLAELTRRGEWEKVAELKTSISLLEQRLAALQQLGNILAPIAEHIVAAPEEIAMPQQRPEAPQASVATTEGATEWPIQPRPV
jgi:hypothetical protein